MGGHEDDHIAAARVGGVGGPEGTVHRQLGEPHLGALLHHDERVAVPCEAGQGGQVDYELAVVAGAVGHGEGPGVVRIPPRLFPPERSMACALGSSDAAEDVFEFGICNSCELVVVGFLVGDAFRRLAAGELLEPLALDDRADRIRGLDLVDIEFA